MTAVTSARRAALDLLLEVERGRRLDVAFAARAPSLPDRDRRFLQELAYGTVRLQGRLDHLLDARLRKGIVETPTELVVILRLGAYQMLEMDGVPAYAAISQAAEQAGERGGKGAAGLVNGVLRALGRKDAGPGRFPDPDRDPAGYLSTWHSHPRWLVERWLRRWPYAEVLALVEKNNAVPPLFLRPLLHSPEEAEARLREGGIEAAPTAWDAPCVELSSGTDPGVALARVPGVIQDPGAALVTVFADPPSGEPAADLCAAPGGKTLALARRASYVFAADRSARRLRLLRENLDRLETWSPAVEEREAGTEAERAPGALAPVRLVVARAEEPPLDEASFVLVDVPCTGTGTFRRHPDARWRLDEEKVAELAAVQARILEGAATVVAPGGTLVYSTCTLEPEENEERVEAFLQAHPGFRREPGSALGSELLDEAGDLRVLPQHTGFDGAYAARLRRVS